MGAYENPRFFSVDYTAGTKAFNQAFQQGLAQGEQIFQQRKEGREDYEETIYSAGDDMLEKMKNLEGDAKMTEEAMQKSLNEFYDHALAVGERQKGIKGLFTAREETRIDGKTLRQYTNSWTSNSAPIKAIAAWTYNQEVNKDLDLDKGDSAYEDQMYYSKAKEEGRLETKMRFVPGEGFVSEFELKDKNGKVIETVKANKINMLFSSDSRESRETIEKRFGDAYGKDGLITGNAKGEIENELSTLQAKGEEGYIKARDILAKHVDRTDGLTKYINKETGTLNLEVQREDGTTYFDINKIPSSQMKDTNDIYNNKVPASQIEKIDAFKSAFKDTNLSNEQIARVMDKAMLIGVDGLLNDRQFKEGGSLELSDEQATQIEQIYAASLVAKHKLTRDYKINTLEANGLLDEFNKPEEQQETGGLTEFQKKGIYDENRYYNVQKSDLNRSLNDFTNVIDVGFEVDNMQVNQGAEELKGIFKNKKYEFDGGEKTSITDVNVDYDGNITIYAGDPKSYKVTLKPGDPEYNPDVPIANVKFLADTDAKTATFSAYSPSDYKKLLINFGAEAKDPRNYEVKANDEIIIRAKELANKGKFKDPRYRQWFNELNRTQSGKKWLQEWAQKNEANATGPLWDEITGNNTPANTGGAYDDLN